MTDQFDKDETEVDGDAQRLREFGEKLRGHINRSGLSLTELSRRSTLSKGHLSSLSLGRRRPSRMAIDRLAQELGLSEEETAGLIAICGCGDDESSIRPGRPLGSSNRVARTDESAIGIHPFKMVLGDKDSPRSVAIHIQPLGRGEVNLRFYTASQVAKPIRMRVEIDGREYYPWIEILPGETRDFPIRASQAEVQIEAGDRDCPEFLTYEIPPFVFGILK